MPLNTLFSYRTEETKRALFNANHTAWAGCERATIDRYWDGRSVIREKGYSWNNLTRVSSLWNDDTIFFYFKCWFDKLNIHPEWEPGRRTPGLWERDVVEVFIRPESCDEYFEMEVSPAGQWLDAHIVKPRSDIRFNWDSKLKTKVEINQEEKIWRAFLAVPFEPIIETAEINQAPEVGEAWRLNLYRIAGEEPEREFLAWRPTNTPEADFHVPNSFGNLIFLDGQP